MKKKIILVSLLFLFILVMFMLIVFVSSNGGNHPSPQTPLPTSPIEGAFPGVKNTPEDTEQSRRSYLVGDLIEKLPYSGKNFSLYYILNTSQFVLYISPRDSTGGNNEFDAFLKQNGVDDRSWIENLVITNNSVTPAP